VKLLSKRNFGFYSVAPFSDENHLQPIITKYHIKIDFDTLKQTKYVKVFKKS